jgi:hypothetical protein
MYVHAVDLARSRYSMAVGVSTNLIRDRGKDLLKGCQAIVPLPSLKARPITAFGAGDEAVGGP